MSKLIKITLVVILSFVFSVCMVRAIEFEIQHADLLEADKQEINVKGNILVKYKNAIIEAPTGKINIDSDGKANNATFSGRVKVKLKDRKLEADKIIVLINNKEFFAYDNTIAELKDKKNNIVKITGDYQHFLWVGEGADAKGNLKTIYLDTTVYSDKCEVVYKNHKPSQAIFSGNTNPANLEQPTNITSAKAITFDITTQNVHAFGNAKSTVWTDKTLSREKQDSIQLATEEIFIDNETGTVTAKDNINKAKITYQETKGESKEAILLKDLKSGKPEKIIFKGNANVNQPDKELSSEEIVFNFTDKKLTSTTQTNSRPKTIIFKRDQKDKS